MADKLSVWKSIICHPNCPFDLPPLLCHRDHDRPGMCNIWPMGSATMVPAVDQEWQFFVGNWWRRHTPLLLHGVQYYSIVGRHWADGCASGDQMLEKSRRWNIKMMIRFFIQVVTEPSLRLDAIPQYRVHPKSRWTILSTPGLSFYRFPILFGPKEHSCRISMQPRRRSSVPGFTEVQPTQYIVLFSKYCNPPAP